MKYYATMGIMPKRNRPARPIDILPQAVARPGDDKKGELLCPNHQKFFIFNFLSPILHSATGFAVVHIALASSFAVQAVTSANRLFSDIPKLGSLCPLSGVKQT